MSRRDVRTERFRDLKVYIDAETECGHTSAIAGCFLYPPPPSERTLDKILTVDQRVSFYLLHFSTDFIRENFMYVEIKECKLIPWVSVILFSGDISETHPTTVSTQQQQREQQRRCPHTRRHT